MSVLQGRRRARAWEIFPDRRCKTYGGKSTRTLSPVKGRAGGDPALHIAVKTLYHGLSPAGGFDVKSAQNRSTPSVRLRQRILRKLLRFSCGSLPDGCKSRTLRWKRPRSCPSALARSAQTSRAGPEACAAGSRPGSKARRRSCCCVTRPCGRSAPSGSRGACR